jgi:short subunit fatty acids transporter
LKGRKINYERKKRFLWKLTDGCVSLVSKYLPDAFIFAVILTIFVFIVTIPASGVAASETVSTFQRFINIIFKVGMVDSGAY